ncbi:DUF4190 domain-containing protein [Streptomyces sp. NBC_00876]|uniref:DUF4190 domain-containing protein n=1 Tax=Streptomyces sp. NBC_00876 TaxID=2975853 RepID=UPI0038646B93|nr:DUF4190 domain-containing protein [Streptomyces sp. NBC_00876]
MSDNTERPADGSAPRDPWAPPDNRVPLDKNTGDTGPQTDGATGHPGPSPVHDQQTVTSMPSAGTGPLPTAGFGAPDTGQQPGPADWQGPGAVPPPPVGPHGPGQPAPPPVGQYGYPAQAPTPQYGYPAAPPQPYGDYPGYPGYGQNAWGGPQPANGMGIASLVLGIIAVVGFCMYGLGIVLGVLALIFGLIGRGRASRGEANNGGVALAGIILGSIGIVISAAFLGFFIWAVTTDDFEEDSGSVSGSTSLSLVVDAARESPAGV